MGLAFVACTSGTLQRTTGGIQPPIAALVFPSTWVGYPSHLSIVLVNTAPQSRAVTVTSTPPFSAPKSVTAAASASAALSVEFEPDSAGAAAGLLTIATPDGSFSVQLSGEGVVPPNCEAPDACHSAVFEPDAGVCVTETLADATPCGADELCLSDATCQGGQCLGGSVDCDDGNVCTTDACDPMTGCVHTDISNACPAATAICQAAICNPISGCGIGPAPDGTLCGTFSCTTSQVCLGGSCGEAPTPQGAPCSPDYPCQAHGSCNDGACVIPDAGILSPVWTYSPPDGYALTFRGLVDSNNDVYWVECSTSDCLLASSTQSGYARFRSRLSMPGDAGAIALPGPGALALAGGLVLYVAPLRFVCGMDSETGDLLWTADLQTVMGADGGGPIALGKPTISGDGGIAFVPVNRAAHSLGLGDAGAWLATLTLPSGSVAAMTPWASPISSVLTGADGTMYVASGGQVSSVSPAAVLSSLPDGPLDLRAVSGGWLYAAIDGGALGLSTADAGTHSIGLVSAPLGVDGIAAEAGAGFVLGYSETDAGVVPSLRGLDPASAETTWLLILDPGTSVTSPLLTSRTSAILLGAVDGASSPWLTEITASGDVPYVCSLPASTPTTLQSAALGTEVLFAQESMPDGGSQLQAFDMVGVQPSNSGWVGPRGNSSLSGSELGP